MKLNKSAEQAIYVLTILALSKDHRPVKSQVLSHILEVKDSYLKKILMKLSKAGLVHATISRQGGYQLAMPVERIGLGQVLEALDAAERPLKFSHLGLRIYEDADHVAEGEEKIRRALSRGEEAYYKQLNGLKVSELLYQEAYEQGTIDWEAKVGEEGQV